MKSRIAYITTCRSDYSASYWLLHDLFSNEHFDVKLIVGGSHLSIKHGYTVSEIEHDGWPIEARIPFITDECDTAEGYGEAAGLALSACVKLLSDMKPDILLLYGDRFELLPIATAAVITRTPVGHLCGGDITVGAIDEQVRHAITKIAHVHFASTPLSAARIVQMGEESWRVHHAGDTAVDQFVRGDKANIEEISKALGGLVPDSKTLLVTFHPPTLEVESIGQQITELVEALRKYEGTVIITAPSPDPGASVIRKALHGLAQHRRHTVFVENLGGRLYRGLLFHVGAMVGNSSSGLNEAPAVPLPVVNIGSRQEGRERAANVIDVSPDFESILFGINKAMNHQFLSTLADIESPYGKGGSAQRIAKILTTLPDKGRLLRKCFVTLPQCALSYRE